MNLLNIVIYQGWAVDRGRLRSRLRGGRACRPPGLIRGRSAETMSDCRASSVHDTCVAVSYSPRAAERPPSNDSPLEQR